MEGCFLFEPPPYENFILFLHFFFKLAFETPFLFRTVGMGMDIFWNYSLYTWKVSYVYESSTKFVKEWLNFYLCGAKLIFL